MATVIKSMSDLTKIIEPRIIKALELTRDKIFKVVSGKVSDYYDEPVFNPPNKSEPDYYSRTYQLMEGLSGGNIIKHGNSYEFTVGWDDEYLKFTYPCGFVKYGLDSSSNEATGLQVLNWFNSKSHGGTVRGAHKYFDEAIDELGGKEGIINMFKTNLRNCGIHVK